MHLLSSAPVETDRSGPSCENMCAGAHVQGSQFGGPPARCSGGAPIRSSSRLKLSSKEIFPTQ